MHRRLRYTIFLLLPPRTLPIPTPALEWLCKYFNKTNVYVSVFRNSRDTDRRRKRMGCLISVNDNPYFSLTEKERNFHYNFKDEYIQVVRYESNGCFGRFLVKKKIANTTQGSQEGRKSRQRHGLVFLSKVKLLFIVPYALFGVV